MDDICFQYPHFPKDLCFMMVPQCKISVDKTAPRLEKILQTIETYTNRHKRVARILKKNCMQNVLTQTTFANNNNGAYQTYTCEGWSTLLLLPNTKF